MEILHNLSQSFWWDVARGCEYATFFHTPLWHRLACETFPDYEDCSVGAICENGIRMVLPVLQTNRAARGLLRNVTSTFAGCYGGIIADGPVPGAAAAELFGAVLKWDVAEFHLSGNPRLPPTAAPRLPRVEERDDFTHILELGGDLDAMISGFSRGHTSSLHKGIRMGVQARLAQTADDYRAFYGAYEDSLRRWGERATNRYPWRLFENVFRLSQAYPQHVKLWLAEVEGKTIAGALAFYWNGHIAGWHSAAHADYFDYCPNNVLHTEIIREGLEQGYRYYDFSPSGGHEGSARFKERFGADRKRFPRWHYVRSALQLVRKLGS